MRHSGLNKKLFGLVFGLVVTIPFVLQGIGHKGWDPIGQVFGLGSTSDLTAGTQTIVDEVAKTEMDPSLNMANQTAQDSNRATTIADIWSALSDYGIATNPDDPSNPSQPTTGISDGSGSSAGVVSSGATVPVFTNQGDHIHAVFNAFGVPGVCDLSISPTTNLAIRTCRTGKV